MGQVTSKLRRYTSGYFWFCPGCDELNPLPDSWTFNGNLERPTFQPSFKHTTKRYRSYSERGLGLGEPYEFICHYIVTDGNVAYCGDSTHALAGQTIPMPDLPPEHRDDPNI